MLTSRMRRTRNYIIYFSNLLSKSQIPRSRDNHRPNKSNWRCNNSIIYRMNSKPRPLDNSKYMRNSQNKCNRTPNYTCSNNKKSPNPILKMAPCSNSSPNPSIRLSSLLHPSNCWRISINPILPLPTENQILQPFSFNSLLPNYIYSRDSSNNRM